VQHHWVCLNPFLPFKLDLFIGFALPLCVNLKGLLDMKRQFLVLSGITAYCVPFFWVLIGGGAGILLQG
jgi:hypothetical protein